MTVPLTPEHNLLISLARLNPESAVREQVATLVSGWLDWETFVALTVRHRVFPMVYRNLAGMGCEVVPVWVIERLRRMYLKNTARSLILGQSLVKILDLLDARGIPALPFKGPSLSEYVYRDSTLRVFSDLDILVPVAEAPRARDCLVAGGYVMDFEIRENQLADYLDKENFFHLSGADGAVSIDLHWEISGRYALTPMVFDDYANALIRGTFQGRTIPAMNDEPLFVYLCIHNSSHGWDHLERITCLAELIRRSVDLDARALISEARKRRSLRMLLTGCELARRLFQVRLPGPVDDLIRADKTIGSLADAVLKKLFKDQSVDVPEISWRFSLLHLRSRDSLWDYVYYGLRLMFRPTIKEWMVCPLPPALSILYPLIRPFRLAREYAIFRKRLKSVHYKRY